MKLKNEMITLGLVDKTTGETFAYSYGKITPINREAYSNVVELPIYPYSYFSSLDNDYINFNKYRKTYLKVYVSSKEDEEFHLDDYGRKISALHDVNVLLIEEFTDIFAYFKNFLDLNKSNLDWGFKAFIIHELPNNEVEKQHAIDIIKVLSKRAEKTDYKAEISISPVTIEYVHLAKDYTINFTNTGTCRKDHFMNTDKALDAKLIFDVIMYSRFPSPRLLTLEGFNVDNFNKYADGDYNKLSQIFSYLEGDDVEVLEAKGFDIKFLLELRLKEYEDRHYVKYLDGMGNYIDVDLYEYLDDTTVELEHHNSFEYYCCEDCDGEAPDYYEWTEDTQRDLMMDIFLYNINNMDERYYGILDKFPTYALNKVVNDIKGIKEYLTYREKQEG